MAFKKVPATIIFSKNQKKALTYRVFLLYFDSGLSDLLIVDRNSIYYDEYGDIWGPQCL